MSWRPRVLVLCTLASATVVLPAAAEGRTFYVRGEAEFQRVERQVSGSGGTIVLLPQLYRRLIVSRRSARPLRIVGTRGARVAHVLLNEAQRVSFGRVRIGPVGRRALVEVRGSRHVVLHDLVVSARGTRSSATVLVSSSRHVTIRRSNFMHCGDRSRRFTNCVTIWRWSHDVTIEDNHFHDCLGCDFVHGRFGSDLVIRRNRFERSLPCRINPNRCGHQDLVQLFAGKRLRVERNQFGVYKGGGAQLYLTNNVDYATIVNNVFVGTDPRVPDYRARMGIVIGSNASRRLPHHARVLNNTILTGARRRDGYSGSIRMSSRYGSVPRWKRPIIANNVIALLETPARVCNGAYRFVDNVVIRGSGCFADDLVGPAGLDGLGRPRAVSSVIDGADRRYAPARDAMGRRRLGRPDIGAFEYRGG